MLNNAKYSNLDEVVQPRVRALSALIEALTPDPEEIAEFRLLDKQSKAVVKEIYFRDYGDAIRNEVEGVDVNYE